MNPAFARVRGRLDDVEQAVKRARAALRADDRETAITQLGSIRDAAGLALVALSSGAT